MSKPRGFSSNIPTSVRSAKQRQQQQQSIEQIFSQLSLEEQQVLQSNPHLGQVFACQREFVRQPIFTQDHRIIPSIKDAPKAPYVRRTEEIKTVVHSGQRKLLLTEIEFLSQYADNGDIVIYAGAAPGTHQTVLQTMFPFLTFLLYDPFPSVVKDIPSSSESTWATENWVGGREVHEEFFTHRIAEQLAHRYAGRRLLFISDIRRQDENGSSEEREQFVAEDMAAQRAWVSILNPVAYMLKLRPKYGSGTTQYLGGLVYIQPWPGITSSETRLIGTDRTSTMTFSNQDYEDALFYHNTVTRTTYFEQIEGLPGLPAGCHCYDCSAELFIIGQYLNRFGLTFVEKLVGRASDSVSTAAEALSNLFRRDFQKN